jgi:hypothetical protein
MTDCTLEKVPTVYVVHCVDAEGPLDESLEATFERLGKTFGITLEASEENLERLRNGLVDLDVQTEPVREFLKPHLMDYCRDWDAVENMLARATSFNCRNRYPDSYGKGWVYTWCCVDHVGYVENPRRRDLGHHHIFDRYRSLVRKDESHVDAIGFHYHPLPFNKLAHACATSYLNGNHLLEILARKVIDKQWFPTVFRPGFHVTRPDSNWFLEQWIPFDYANQSIAKADEQPDLANGRFGDWRRAPRIWGAYHPHHDDYQSKGQCRRWIFRCLNVESRLRQITREEIVGAFSLAASTGKAVLAVTSHDFRDLSSEVDRITGMISSIAQSYPDVRYRFSDALTAARAYLDIEKTPEIGLQCSFTTCDDTKALELNVTTRIPLFGPQPFLAILDDEGNYLYDNCDFDLVPNSWFYRFDWQTVSSNKIVAVGIAAPGACGQVDIAVHNLQRGTVMKRRLNYIDQHAERAEE